MSNPKVILCMPTRDRPHLPAWNAAAVACATYAHAAIMPMHGEPRDVNRNRCVRQFLDREDSDWMLWVDDDTLIPPDTVARLLAHDKPFVTGVQPLCLDGILVANVRLGPAPDGRIRAWPDWICWQRPAAPFRALYCGFGCVLTHRSLLTDIGNPWFVENYGDLYGRNNVTEDIHFCERAAACGFELWCDPQVVCGHLKIMDMRDWLPRKQVNMTVTTPVSEELAVDPA